MLRIVSVAALAAAAFAAPAFAADLPMYEPAPVAASGTTWSGPYAGVQAGYAKGHATNRGGNSNTEPKGFTVGGFVGANHQFDGSPVVIGAETDLNYDTMKDNDNVPRGRVGNQLNWSGATRGRIGYGTDRVLVYGAAGLAYGGHEASRRVGNRPGSSQDKTAVGYTVGGGVETIVADNVTARVDYRYNDYGTDKFKVANGGMKSNLTENRLTGGLAYKFSSW
ncbi:outer membrane protein [Methylopila sp. M107]|uniref:outer membrane protein n=1 Tax=Methylopila sp. M107 TaxID=1101190 RepID=UPI0003642345|nr:outer membrane protein [Methylopila sp. M107]